MTLLIGPGSVRVFLHSKQADAVKEKFYNRRRKSRPDNRCRRSPGIWRERKVRAPQSRMPA